MKDVKLEDVHKILKPLHDRIDQLYIFFSENNISGNFAPRVNFFKGGCSGIKYEITETDKLVNKQINL